MTECRVFLCAQKGALAVVLACLILSSSQRACGTVVQKAPAKGQKAALPAKGSSPAGKPNSPIKDDLTLMTFAPPAEATSQIQGVVMNLPSTATTLQVALLLTGRDGKERPALLKSAAGSALVYKADVDAGQGTFALNLASPLAAGISGRVMLLHPGVDITGAIKDETAFSIPADLPEPRILVTLPVKGGMQTVEGSATPMPDPPLASNLSASPPVTGNLPSVMVMLHDPKTASTDWYPAEQQAGSATTTVDRQEIQKDGTFRVQLKTPLKAGQELKVKLVAPVGRSFTNAAETTTQVTSAQNSRSTGPAVIAEELHSAGLARLTSSSEGEPRRRAPISVEPSQLPQQATRRPDDAAETQSATPAIAEASQPVKLARQERNPAGVVNQEAPTQKRANEAMSDDPMVGPPVPLTPPLIKTHDEAGKGTITGSATASVANGDTVNVAIISGDQFADHAQEDLNGTVPACLTAEQAARLSSRFLPLTLSSGTGSVVPTATTGDFTLTVATPLLDGQRFYAVEILPAGWTEGMTDEQVKTLCRTTISVVQGTKEWGRIHADFAAGVLISNDSNNSTAGSTTAGSGNFSQAHQFYALSVEKVWSLPKCYIRVEAHPEIAEAEDGSYHVSKHRDQCYDWNSGELYAATRKQHLWPGFNTYFQTRLTAIPVSTVASKNTTTTPTPATPSAASLVKPAATTATTTIASDPTSNLLTAAQTARVEVGAYLPFFVGRWEYDHRPNALFIAPLAKVGFDTVTGPSTVNTISPDGSILSQTFEQVYDFWSYGARIGHMELSHSQNRAPETYSYLDITFGPYSSLQSFICHPIPATAASVLPANSRCGEYTDNGNLGVESRKRLYRFDIEGLLKIPKTDFYLGLNANIGQRTIGAVHLDQGFAAPDDLRFFFGTKFDIASVLTKFNLGAH